MSEAEWKMPIVEVGDSVLFSRDLSARKYFPALVMAVHNNAIEIALCGGNLAGRNQVRHRDDPLIKNRPDLLEDSGVFDLTPATKRLRALETQVASMAEQMARQQIADSPMQETRRVKERV